MGGLHIEPAVNGGWLVTDSLGRNQGYAPAILAALSTDEDLIKWLQSYLGGRRDAKLKIEGGSQ